MTEDPTTTGGLPTTLGIRVAANLLRGRIPAYLVQLVEPLTSNGFKAVALALADEFTMTTHQFGPGFDAIIVAPLADETGHYPTLDRLREIFVPKLALTGSVSIHTARTLYEVTLALYGHDEHDDEVIKAKEHLKKAPGVLTVTPTATS